MLARRILFFTRTRRWLMAAGAMRNARPICVASRPSTVCNINGVRISGSIAGCAQTNSSLSRSSGIALDSAECSDSFATSRARISSVSAFAVAHLVVSSAIREASASRRQQPGFGTSWNAVTRPGGERGDERVAQRILSASDVTGTRGQERDEPAVTLTRDRFHGTSNSRCRHRFSPVMRRQQRRLCRLARGCSRVPCRAGPCHACPSRDHR